MMKVAAFTSKCASLLERIVKIIAITLLVILVCAVFFQVARRTITGKSFVQIEEFSIVMASWCAFITIAYAARRQVHVRIEVFTEKLPPRLHNALQLAIHSVIFTACLFIVYYGGQLAGNKVKVPMTVLPISQGIWYASIPVGMLFTCLFLADHIVQALCHVLYGKAPDNSLEEGGV